MLLSMPLSSSQVMGFHYGIASTRKQIVVLDRVGWLAGEQDLEWRRNTLIFLHGQRLQFQPWLQWFGIWVGDWCWDLRLKRVSWSCYRFTEPEVFIKSYHISFSSANLIFNQRRPLTPTVIVDHILALVWMILQNFFLSLMHAVCKGAVIWRKLQEYGYIIH